MLYRMLEFNPNKRITAEEALKDPYFDDIRLPEQENIPEDEIPEIYLPVDDHTEEALDMEELRRLIIRDINLLSSDLFDFENDFEYLSAQMCHAEAGPAS